MRFARRTLILVIVKIRCVDQQGSLFGNHADHTRMVVAEGVHADAGDEIQVAAAIGIPYVGAFTMA